MFRRKRHSEALTRAEDRLARRDTVLRRLMPPGSILAARAGCRCSVTANREGRDPGDEPFVTQGCPFHSETYEMPDSVIGDPASTERTGG